MNCAAFGIKLGEIKKLKIEFDLELENIWKDKKLERLVDLEKNIKLKVAEVKMDLDRQHIAQSEAEINTHTKKYIGKLFPGIFQKGLREIWTSADRKIETKRVDVGGESANILLSRLSKFKIDGMDCYVSEEVTDLIEEKYDKPAIKIAYEIVKLSCTDLGFDSFPNLRQIYKRAIELGLELCRSDTGPYLRLQYTEQKQGEKAFVAALLQTRKNGNHGLFYLDYAGRSMIAPGIVIKSSEMDDIYNMYDEFFFVKAKGV
jgi:hypothetical protein